MEMKSIFGPTSRRLICLTVAGFLQPAYAQTGFMMQGPAEQSGAPVIRDALGRPCLDIEAAARAEVINPKMMDHIVSLKNNCPRTIHAKVCYFNSQRCDDIIVQGHKRVDTTLGTMRGVQFFRYTVIPKLAP